MMQIFNTFINIFTYEELNNKIINSINSNQTKITFFCLNSFALYLMDKNPRYREIFNKAHYIIPDGISIPIAFKYLHNKKINKVSVNLNFFLYFENILIEKKYKVFLLGAHKKTIKKVNDILISKGINVVGYNDGYNIDDKIIDKINQSSPDILMVGMGMPKQEIWTIENLEKLNVKVISIVGGLFDILAGEASKTPKWIANSPFEWLYRLVQNPKQFFPRYIKCQPYYLYLLIKTYFSNKFK